MLNRSGDRPNPYPEGEEAEMKPSRRYQERQARVPNLLQLTSKPTGVSQPRQSPTTDIRRLTRLVFESYQDSYPSSSPKVRARYHKLIEELSRRGIADGIA
jgi:hypothetical protein